MKSDIEVRVVDLARGGAGVARDETGRVIFIPLTAPGDRVRVRVLEEDKRYAQAEILEILEFSPIREKPPCPVFGKCGGCQWQHLKYDLQWETKFKGVLHALSRVEVSLPQEIAQIPASQIWEYRNRVQLRGERGQIGFYRQGSKELVPIEKCFIARPEINQVLEQSRVEGARLKKPFKVEIEVMPTGEVRQIWNARHAAGGFRQVHDEQNERLKNWVAQEIPVSDVLLDLFGGSGNLSFPLVGKVGEIHCVDLSAPHHPPPGAPAHLHFHRNPVLTWLMRQTSVPSDKERTVSAILDPPREGLGIQFTEIARALEVFRVRHLVAVGCDADSWARDISRWVKKGWKLQKLMMLDLFPQTPHVESVALLTRSY